MSTPIETLSPPVLSRRGAAILMLIGAVIISASAPLVRVADVAPTTSAFYRMLFGGIGLLIWCLASRRPLKLPNPRYAAGITLIAVFFVLDLYFWHRSIHYIGPGLATLLGNLQVFILALIGWVWLREPLRVAVLLGVGLALAGIWLLVGMTWADVGGQYQLGVALGLATAAVYAVFLLGLRRVQGGANALSPPANLSWIAVICVVMVAGLNAAEGHSFTIPNGKTLVALLAYGLLCQVLGWILITRAMPQLPAALVGAFLLLQPTLSFVWDMIFFDRPTTLIDLTGVGLVLAGIYVANRAYEDQ